MRRLARDQLVALTVGDATIDCRVVHAPAEEVSLAPVQAAQSGRLPTASRHAELVFSHEGRLIMLRGAFYRGDTPGDIRFAEGRTGRAGGVAEQRRRAARLAITLPATITELDRWGNPTGEERPLVTRDVSIGGIALATDLSGLSTGAIVRFELVLADGAMIAGTARIARTAADRTGLEFAELAAVERVRLAGFLARQSARASRAATAPAADAGAAAPPKR